MRGDGIPRIVGGLAVIANCSFMLLRTDRWMKWQASLPFQRTPKNWAASRSWARILGAIGVVIGFVIILSAFIDL